MRKLMIWIGAAVMLPAVAVADVCAPGASIRYPDYRVVETLGLSVVVDARDHPAMDGRADMTVSERTAALETALSDILGDEPEAVQELRLLGVFAMQFGLRREYPSMSSVFSEPEYLPATLPVLQRYGVDSGVKALQGAADAFWFFESLRTDQMLTQLAFNSVIGATIDDARAAAPNLLVASRAEVDAAIATLEATDSSVAAVMMVTRDRISDFDRRSYLERLLRSCIGPLGVDGRPDNWDDIPQPQRDLLVLMLVEGAFDYLPDFFIYNGWILEDALRVMDDQGLPHHAAALRDALALFPAVMPRFGPEWEDRVWDVAGALEDAAHGNLYDPLRREQDPDYEVSYDLPLTDAMVVLARQQGLWPAN